LGRSTSGEETLFLADILSKYTETDGKGTKEQSWKKQKCYYGENKTKGDP